jgi:parallel beta-helix repeat protein
MNHRWPIKLLRCLLPVMLLTAFAPAPGHATSLQVTSIEDSGTGTLRQALLSAMAGDTITFSPTVFQLASPASIQPRSALPALDKAGLTLDATGAGVVLDGTSAGIGTDGLKISGSGCLVRGLVIQHFTGTGVLVLAGATNNTIDGNVIIHNGGSGIEIRGATNRIQGNRIGVDPTGAQITAGNGYNGVAIWEGASGNVVGGDLAAQRNVIGGNNHNGVWIEGATTHDNQVIGNYLGVWTDGLQKVPNLLSGASMQDGAHDNVIRGNLISGNADNGVWIGDPGSTGNRVLGNRIGTAPDGLSVVGQGDHGIVITLGASSNVIGDGTPAGRNLISGNKNDGILIEGAATSGNVVQGNYIGTNATGLTSLPNGVHGVELANSTHDNLIGGNRLTGQGNLLSGNRNHGIVITDGAHHNSASGNIVGPNIAGTEFLGNHPFGGIDVSNGAHHNIIGGLAAGEGNLVSGNPTDGIALFTSDGRSVTDTQLLGNLIGTQLDDVTELSNHGYGIMLGTGAVRTTVEGNTIAFNESYGVLVATCDGNTITANTIYSNTLAGIRFEGTCLAPPSLQASYPLYANETVTGTTIPNGRVEIFADTGEQGRVYEGFTIADAVGKFSVTQAGQFAGPNVTATVTDGSGNTSAFSRPVHLDWTILLYFNGDNDLEHAVLDTLDNLAAAGPSAYANVLALVDGYTDTLRSGTGTYDLTWGGALSLGTAFTTTAEVNMGNWESLAAFGAWGREYYPARHTLLAILDHGGGWAPSDPPEVGDVMPHRMGWMAAGASGLSWDFTNGYEHLDTVTMRKALAAITTNGEAKLDVLFYDVCLMGMLEVAYQVADYADFYVSSQNIGWAPEGADGRYVRALHGNTSSPAPRVMAQRLVEAYAAANPPEEHPFTVSAVDLRQVNALAYATSYLGLDIRAIIEADPAQKSILYQAYTDTQKLDYNADFVIDPQTEGFVDLYDFAVQAAARFGDGRPWIVARANEVITDLETAVVAERHQSGTPWFSMANQPGSGPNSYWNLDRVHGLSVFLPLGQDLQLHPVATTLPITYIISLRDLYNCAQLQMLCDTRWVSMTDEYYSVGAPVPTATMTNTWTLPPPDVMPPEAAITLAGSLRIGQEIRINWSATDTQSGVAGAALWYRSPSGKWVDTGQSQAGSSGEFRFTLSQGCGNGFSVRAIDNSGNLEPIDDGANVALIEVPWCLRLPLVMRGG